MGGPGFPHVAPHPSSEKARAFPIWAVAGLVAFGALHSPKPAAGADPYLLWETIETKHFRISYYSGEREVALHVADLAEAIHARIAPVLGYEPDDRTEIALTDGTDSANGSATALPYNAVRLYVTAADDLSPLGDVDDWYLELLTHEYTHILHLDNIHGIPSLVNAILGKTLAPNQAQPRWITEGLAVFIESTRTSGGRLRSSQWNMYMRTDVLEGNIAPLDQFGNNPRRWPQGNIWYLYGSFFMEYMADVWGEDAIRRMIRYYGGQLVPWGINRAFREATGKTFEDVYPSWVQWLRRHFAPGVAQVRERGLREGVNITRRGQTAENPRFLPPNAFSRHNGDVLYFRDDGHSLGGLYRVPIARDEKGRIIPSNEAELLVRTAGASTPSFAPDGDLVFEGQDVYNGIYFFSDLFRLKAGQTSTWGLDGRRERLSTGYRASQASVSPDGRRVAFVTNHRGTTYLQLADLRGDGMQSTHALVKSQSFEQVFSPRWSPDNRHLVYSVWTKGGYRDLRVVDTGDGTYEELWHDRAVDGGPSFSPDGKAIYFHSDRTGIMNVYAYELATKRLRQVTNVLTGAYQPQVSADGKTLVYLGYSKNGFDLFAMDLDEARFLEPLPYEDPHPAPPTDPPAADHVIKPYSPWSTLRPRNYSIDTFPSTFGQTFRVGIGGSDIAGWHSFNASLSIETERPDPQFSVGYGYNRLPFSLGISAYRALTPRNDIGFGSGTRPITVQETLGLGTSLSYPLSRAFDGQSVAISYSVTRTGADVEPTVGRLDPYDRPTFATRGMLPFLNVGWSYGNAQRFLWSVAAEKGFSANANATLTHPAIGSPFEGLAASAGVTQYFLMPWLSHHSLGVALNGGLSTGNYPGAGPYYIGGFVEPSIVDTIRNLYVQGGIVLRGYPAGSFFGKSYALSNIEYRFPILTVDRGISTLPLYLSRVTGAVFTDVGSTFDDITKASFKVGSGGEIWFDTQLGYVISMTFRLGFAHGFSTGGIDKLYFVAAAPF